MAIEDLTPAQINQLAADGVTALRTTTSDITLTVAQALGLDAAGISVQAGVLVYVSDTAANLAPLTSATVAQLAAIGVKLLYADNAPLVLTASAGGAAILTYGMDLASQSGSVTLTDLAVRFEALSQSTITAYQTGGVTQLLATDAPVALSTTEAAELKPANIAVASAMGAVSITDTAANIETLGRRHPRSTSSAASASPRSSQPTPPWCSPPPRSSKSPAS